MARGSLPLHCLEHQRRHIAAACDGKGSCDYKVDHTAIGDPVNTASRLCSIARAGEIRQPKRREKLIEFAEQNQIPIAKDKRGEAPFSVDANLLHSSSEGKVLEDPAVEPPPYVYQRTISPMTAPDKVTTIKIGFEKGDAVSLDGRFFRRFFATRSPVGSGQAAEP